LDRSPLAVPLLPATAPHQWVPILIHVHRLSRWDPMQPATGIQLIRQVSEDMGTSGRRLPLHQWKRQNMEISRSRPVFYAVRMIAQYISRTGMCSFSSRYHFSPHLNNFLFGSLHELVNLGTQAHSATGNRTILIHGTAMAKSRACLVLRASSGSIFLYLHSLLESGPRYRAICENKKCTH
jgi:hypothetical protein